MLKKTLSSNKVKQLNKKLKTSKNTNKKNKAKFRKQQKQLNQAATELYYIEDELKEKEAEIKILKKEKQNLQSWIWQFQDKDTKLTNKTEMTIKNIEDQKLKTKQAPTSVMID